MCKRASDMDAVSRVLNHPKVYKWISDDLSPATCVPDPCSFYLMDDACMGVIRIDRLTGTSCMVHIATLPEMKGKTQAFVEDAIKWLFEKTCYSKIVSLAPECNRAAIVFGKSCGFKVEGKITKSFLKNWKLYDQVVFGLSKYDKEVLLCQ